MLATLNWNRIEAGSERRAGGSLHVMLFFWLFAVFGVDESVAADQATFAKRAQKNYETAKKDYAEDAANGEKAWIFGRACFDRAEFSVNKSERAALAKEGIAATRVAVKLQPKNAAGHYFLAMNLGQMARTRSLGALPIVGELESSLKSARALNAKFHHAGADRSLGLLYRDAPGWPLSVGSDKKARAHLAGAVSLDPEYPENRLCLLESLLEWDDEKSIRSEFAATRKVLERAGKRLKGVEWEASWDDWNKRWDQIKRAVARDYSIR